MHRAKATCPHGHPWYRLDCTRCCFDEFHDLLRLSLSICTDARRTILEPDPNNVRGSIRFEFDVTLTETRINRHRRYQTEIAARTGISS